MAQLLKIQLNGKNIGCHQCAANYNGTCKVTECVVKQRVFGVTARQFSQTEDNIKRDNSMRLVIAAVAKAARKAEEIHRMEARVEALTQHPLDCACPSCEKLAECPEGCTCLDCALDNAGPF